MCGLVGTVSTAVGIALAEYDLVAKHTQKLSHRGPDARGVEAIPLSWGSTIIGMSRLKIVDQSDLVVPFRFDYLHVIVAFNGEIYNWKALRAELSDGTPWETNCDAEVVARAWAKWGPDCLNHFNGMWGLALVDTSANLVFIARDRAGEKPLYYRELNDSLYFASEIKGLPGPYEETTCPEYSCLEFDCLKKTLFRGIYALEPGQAMLVRDGDLSPRPYTWWSLLVEIVEHSNPVEECQELLTDAIKIRLSAEVPVALLLSGGLDSAIIQAVADADKTYCCTFPEADNISVARLADSRVVPVTFNLDRLREVLPRVAYHLDTPATWTAVCQWFLFERVAADGNKVVLTGEGADELFSGYSRYRILYWLDQLIADPLLANYKPLVELAVGDVNSLLAKLLDRSGTPSGIEHAKTLINTYGRGTFTDQMARTDFYTTMQCLLRMADRMSAAHSLENRSPFFDYRLMEFAASLPSKYKINNRSKDILRKVAENLNVHPTIINEQTKKGLYLPWAQWVGSSGQRGSWSRAGFAQEMRAAWRAAWRGKCA